MPKKGYGGVTLKDETLERLDALMDPLGCDSRADVVRELIADAEEVYA